MCFVNPGYFPSNGDGEVKIHLTEESAHSVSKVAGMKRWTVLPTMTRGSKPLSQLKKPKERKRKFGVRKVVIRKRKPREDNPLKKESEKDVPVEVELGKHQVSELSFRRTPEGRQVIKMEFQKLHEIEQEKFAGNPTFGDDGRCRMRFERSSRFTIDMVTENVAKAVVSMRLILLKYVN